MIYGIVKIVKYQPVVVEERNLMENVFAEEDLLVINVKINL